MASAVPASQTDSAPIHWYLIGFLPWKTNGLLGGCAIWRLLVLIVRRGRQGEQGGLSSGRFPVKMNGKRQEEGQQP
jgi:hypothetical protein